MASFITPTFLLRRVDPSRVLANYRAGKYTSFTLPRSRVKISGIVPIVAPSYGNSSLSGIYTFRDRSNCPIVVATSNHKPFEVFMASGGELPSNGRCDYCKQDFDHTPQGIPIAMAEKFFQVKRDDLPDGEDPYSTVRVYVFWVEGEYCCFEHALGDLHRFQAVTTSSRDVNYADSESWIRLLYHICHPDGDPLLIPPDPRLLAANNGPLSQNEYSSRRHYYQRTASVVQIPAKVEYLRTSLSS